MIALGVATILYSQISLDSPLKEYATVGIIVGMIAISLMLKFVKLQPARTARSLLREKYTKGEITKEEYDKLKEDIE